MAEHRTDERDPRDDARDPWQEGSPARAEAADGDLAHAEPVMHDATVGHDAHDANVGHREQDAHDDTAARAAPVVHAASAQPAWPAEPTASFWATDRDTDPTVTAASADEPMNDAVRAERERLVAERAARKEARLSALNPPPPPVVPVAAPAGSAGSVAAASPSVPAEPVVVTRRSTDAFAGALGLFLLRLVVAAIIGVHGVNKLLNLPATTETLQNTILPAPSILAIVVGAAEVAIAIALLFGLLTRVAGLGLILVAGGALAFVLWGPWSPFRPGQAGFTGELELLLAAVGVLFLLVGGGGWSVDRGFRARRASDKAARAAG